mgnify:CR=1 FL=1
MVTGTDRRQQVSDTSPRRVFRVSSPRSSSIQPDTTAEPRRTKGKKTPKNAAAPQARSHSCPPIEVDTPQEGTGSLGLGATARRRQKMVSDSLQNRQILAHPDKFLQTEVAAAERKARLGVVTSDLEHISRDSSSLLMLRLSSKVETFEQRAALQSTELEQARLQVPTPFVCVASLTIAVLLYKPPPPCRRHTGKPRRRSCTRTAATSTHSSARPGTPWPRRTNHRNR